VRRSLRKAWSAIAAPWCIGEHGYPATAGPKRDRLGVWRLPRAGNLPGGVNEIVASPLLTSGHDTTALFRGLFSFYLVICIAGGVAVAVAIVAVAVRYRNGERPLRRRADAPRWEIAYVAVLAAVAAGLYAATVNTEDTEDALARAPRLRVTVTASQWQWRFRYRGGIVSQGPGARLVVPAEAVVQITLRSADVIHALWIPALRFKRYAYPDHTSRFDVDVPRPLRAWGECAEYCGLRHDSMRFRVVALPDARFRRWLQARSGL
jgi:cytochrome c oxidase subunit II